MENMPNMPLIKIKFQVYPNKVYKKIIKKKRNSSKASINISNNDKII